MNLNASLAYLLLILNPTALGIGAILTLQVWALRKNGRPNPACMVMALVLLCYQAGNAISSGIVWYYNVGYRPTGMLAWAVSRLLIIIIGCSLASLYFAGKLNRKEKKEAC